MDIYPDIAGDIGYFKRNGIVDRIAGVLLDWARRRATAIIVLGEDMKTRLISRGIPEEKIRVAENWADGTEIQPYSLPQGPLVVHYSGNLGLAHETSTIKEVISRLRNRLDIRFVFAGGGPRRLALEEFCYSNGLNNVEFRPYCTRAELGSSLGKGHLGLVTQLPQTLGSIVPSKIYGIMAAGRPLLYIGPDGSTPARHIERFQCGWHIQPGDAKGLEDLLIILSENRELVSLCGSRARTAFEQNFNRAIGISRVLRVLDEHPHIAERNTSFAESVRGDRL
jgi:glycosyltransferase involved in cell wall biosynthesis